MKHLLLEECLFKPSVRPISFAIPYPIRPRLGTPSVCHHDPVAPDAARRVCLQPPRRGQPRGARQAVRQGLCRAHIRRYGPKIMDEPVFRSMSHWMLRRIRRTTPACAAGGEGVHCPPDRGHAPAHPADRRRNARSHHPQGKMDLIEDFAFRLPVTIICDMLGIPRSIVRYLYKFARRRTPARSGAADAGRDQAGNAGNAMRRCIFSRCSSCGGRRPATT